MAIRTHVNDGGEIFEPLSVLLITAFRPSRSEHWEAP